MEWTLSKDSEFLSLQVFPKNPEGVQQVGYTEKYMGKKEKEKALSHVLVGLEGVEPPPRISL